MSQKRRAAERRGRRGELAAALWLMAKGYRILAQRARTPFGEIDILARRGGVLVVVEVKARPSRDAGLSALGPFQRRRIERAAAAAAGRLRLTGLPIRFDVVIVRPFAWPIHVCGAWRAGD